jgi:ABC-2 type transport system ATP-binding protein
MPVDPVWTVRGLRKRFGEKTVLRDVDFELPSGTVLGLVGRNGSGKTTLLKCGLGLLRIDAGETRLFGEPSWDLSAAAKARLGYVPQAIALYPWMRVRQVLTYTAAFYPRWNHDLAASLVKRWDLHGQARVGTLSPGQTQQLAIVLALAHEPEVLILDEPAASLDPAARRQLLQLVLELASGGDRTILFATHIISDLERVADRLAILRNGQIQFSGELDALKDHVKRLHVSAREALPPTLGVPGTLREDVQGPDGAVSVWGFTADLVPRLEQRYQAHVDVYDLTLEDIFLELHQEEPLEHVFGAV